MTGPTPNVALAPGWRPATDLLLGDLADCVQKVRHHEHPSRGEDLYCLNLTSYMGERMGAVLKRLDDERAEVRRWKDKHTALADEATELLGRGPEEEVTEFLGPRPEPTPGTGCRCDWLGEGTPEHAPSPLCRSLRPAADRDDTSRDEPRLIEGDTATEQYDNAAARYEADNDLPPRPGSAS